MALDEKTLERMLKAQRDALEKSKPAPAAAPPPPPERTDLFEEFVREAQPGEPPKPKGLQASGYIFPPDANPALTKANMAKGVGLPQPIPASKEPAPPTELVEQDPLFEEYHRPDLKEKPRTGKGIRIQEEPKTAKEILSGYEPPVPQVFTPRRAPNSPPTPPHTDAPSAHPAPTSPATPPPAPAPPARPSPSNVAIEADAADLDAKADLASAAELTMSHPHSHGPAKVVTDQDPLLDMPRLPGEQAAPRAPSEAATPAPARPEAAPHPAIASARVAPMPAPSFGPAARAAQASPPRPGPPSMPSSPHVSDAPPVRPGSGPRIALVQADFNHDLTTRMADDATAYAKQLGATVTHHLHVAGAFDIPLTAKTLALRSDVDAVVAIGCIIQGETGHDEVIAREVARKLADLAFLAEKPIGLAVTGPRMTKAQAEARIPVARHAVAAVTQQWRGLQALHAAKALAN